MDRYRRFYVRPESHCSNKWLTPMTVITVPCLRPRLTYSELSSFPETRRSNSAGCFGGAAYLQINL